MERFLMNDLETWKSSKRRKPLILNGARQVGKTWLLKEFGDKHYKNTAYLNFDNNPEAQMVFNLDFSVNRIIKDVQNITGEAISEGTTLVIFDEIQECPKALTSLKYFCENAPGIHLVAAGSLLGLTVHEGTGYPVGKVNTLNLYPLSFREFLDATGNAALRQTIDSGDLNSFKIFNARLSELLKHYYVVGGMPEAVLAYLDGGIFEESRQVQKEILDGYRLDAAKHLNGKETEFVLAAWDSIPSQLAKENKKFVFGHIRAGSRARDYRSAITWLTQAGIASKVSRVAKAGMPLSAYKDNQAFKLFILDVGLLGAMAKLSTKSIIEGNSVFSEFKGALTEQYVCQQLISDCSLDPYYWSAENSRGELDFLAQDEDATFAIEVKAEENLRAKSLRAFKEKNPEVEALRFSLSGYRKQDWMRNIPLYAISNRGLWG